MICRERVRYLTPFVLYKMSEKYSDNLQEIAVEMPEVADSDEETNTLIGNVEKRKKKQSCLRRWCKILLALGATSMFVVMIVQLWSNYGDYIENRVFSPSVHSAGVFTREGAVSTYIMKYHQWEEDTLHITVDQPENALVQLTAETPSVFEWGEDCLLVNTTSPNISVVVWSLWSK